MRHILEMVQLYFRPLRWCGIHMDGVETYMYMYMYYKIHTWQSRVENEHYSITYFDHVAVFNALYL